MCICLSDSGPMSLPSHLPNSYLPKEPPPRATESLSSMTLPLRGSLANSSGSPHLGNMIHPPMPPSCIMEELQRAFASKNRQERWVLSLTPCACLYGGLRKWWFFLLNIQYVFLKNKHPSMFVQTDSDATRSAQYEENFRFSSWHRGVWQLLSRSSS